jgi:hypothetical protein
VFDMPDTTPDPIGASLRLLLPARPETHLTGVFTAIGPDGAGPAICVHLGGGLVELFAYHPDGLWELAGVLANAACELTAALDPTTDPGDLPGDPLA